MGSCCNSPDTTLASCPNCGQQGALVNSLTPQHTLKAQFRGEVESASRYYFCENPACRNVYFSEDSRQCFTTDQLINRVTCKDPSPETPLCYCYKINKGDVQAEYRDSGKSAVIQQIESRMAAKACFCDRSNPRGLCCTTEIKNWLMAQGIEESNASSADSCCGSCCS